MYTLVLALIGLYATSGRNRFDPTSRIDENIEMLPHGEGHINTKWYARVPTNPGNGVEETVHVVGEDEED